MDETEEMFIPTETGYLHTFRHVALIVFITISFVILGAGLVLAIIAG